MQFGLVPINEAGGKILAHNLAGSNGDRLLNKGRVLTKADIGALGSNGYEVIYAAWLDSDDIDENTAARRTADAVCGDQVAGTRANVGRVNLKAQADGVLRVDTKRLEAVNQNDGITVATLASNSLVRAGQSVATVKIIPFGVPEQVLEAAVKQAGDGKPVLHIDPLKPLNVVLIHYGSMRVKDRLIRDFGALGDRVSKLGSQVISVDFVEVTLGQTEYRMADALKRAKDAGAALILVAGETAIMHHKDMVPCAVEHAGGVVESVGAPVDPGNLLMLAYLGELPILGAPGCARSPKANVVDQVIPRLLVGEHLRHADIIQLAHGGLLTSFDTD